MRTVRLAHLLTVPAVLAAPLVPSAAQAGPEWRSMSGGVGLDPCALPIVLQPNDSGAYSSDWRNDLSQAVSTVNGALGGTLLRIGSATTSTDEQASPPVHFTDLPGSTAGSAYISWSVDGSGTPQHITKGSIALDAGQFSEMSSRSRVGVIVHEIGHLLGLAHVGDAHEALSNGFLYEGGVGDGTTSALRSLYGVDCGNHPRIGDGPQDWQLPDHQGHASSVRAWNIGNAARNVIELGAVAANSFRSYLFVGR